MRHRRSESFRAHYAALPATIRELADKQFALLKSDPRHPSLRFKRIGPYWAARVGLHYRAAAVEPEPDVLVWFWIGTHAEYDRIIKRQV